MLTTMMTMMTMTMMTMTMTMMRSTPIRRVTAGVSHSILPPSIIQAVRGNRADWGGTSPCHYSDRGGQALPLLPPPPHASSSTERKGCQLIKGRRRVDGVWGGGGGGGGVWGGGQGCVEKRRRRRGRGGDDIWRQEVIWVSTLATEIRPRLSTADDVCSRRKGRGISPWWEFQRNWGRLEIGLFVVCCRCQRQISQTLNKLSLAESSEGKWG